MARERLDYNEATERALELRELAEDFAARARNVFDLEADATMHGPAVAQGAAVLGLAIVFSLLEVGARIELLELDAELGRQE